MRLAHAPPFLLSLTLLACLAVAAQHEVPPPRIVIEANKATAPAGPFSAIDFGKTCRANGSAKRAYMDKSASIADLLGAPVAVVTVHTYRAGWKNQENIRKRVLQALYAEASEVGPSVMWDEAVSGDIVGTVQFSDKTEGAFELSGGHICFNDHSGAVIWTRIPIGG